MTETNTLDHERQTLLDVPTGLLINGQWREASGGARFAVEDPATGNTLLEIADATSDDALAALDAADAVQASWARTGPRERAEVLRRTFDIIVQWTEDFALFDDLGDGQATFRNRFLVEESVVEEFTAKFAGARSMLKPGRGTDPESTVGPLIDGEAREDVHGLVTEAISSGARVVTGGAPLEGEGYFYTPTVLADVLNDAEILTKEIFEPVAPITTFSTEDHAIRLANATEYGLAAYVYTRDHNRLLGVAEQIEYGMVGFNAGVISNAAAPFGGVKQSGLGREGGSEGISEYTATQSIAIADPYAE
ncbi:aldehyde dehydrogenase family protein [Arthrobacter sp. efr-133-TYG-118]|uniref:aldehyde dehydrogenase family protein n=1 Tax=Arthrobacter sp. efr-133-TYG-118 TaxID=3040279 RepID=UPI00254D118A|nr:aldehyde dehydrogenase family protein [Arthrobacter sp. efr-133-TYG-118]